MKRKVLALVLSGAMILGGLPATVMAAGNVDTEQDTSVQAEAADEAIDEAAEDAEVIVDDTAVESPEEDAATDEAAVDNTEAETKEDATETEDAVNEDAEETDAELVDTEEVVLEEEADLLEARPGYQVILPDGYSATGTERYPTVYVMPYDGYSPQTYFDDGFEGRVKELMASDAAMDMIFILPQFAEGNDYREMLADLVADVDSKYNTIADKNFRGILGVNVGAYMAYETALISESDLFYAVGGHMGDFTSDANPYLSNGSVAEVAAGLDDPDRRSGYAKLQQHYYYLDAPNGSDFTTVANGTTTIGAELEKRTNPYYSYGGSWYLYSNPDISMVEYNILDGEANAAYYLKQLERSLNRFSVQFTGRMFSSDLSCTPQAVTSADATVTAKVKMTFTEDVLEFLNSAPKVDIRIEMTDPATGEVLSSKTTTMPSLAIGQTGTATVTLDAADMADGVNTTLTAYGSFLGMEQTLGTLSMVAVQDTGEADDEQLVDLMGNWYFHAYKTYKRNDTTVVDLDKIENITPDVYESWNVVQPGLGWWTEDFSTDEGFGASYGGYAWYVRTFDLPETFPKEGLVLSGGYFDEANEMFINGQRVGSLGMDYTKVEGVGVYDGSNPWDINSFYELDSSILNYGGENTIAVRMCNSSGGGGWYEGPIGIYSVAAYNKAMGKPSTYADDASKSAVLALIQTQKEAIESEDIDAYKATIAADFFESGYNKERQTEKIQGWIDAYDDIKVIDSGAGVFVDGDLFNYEATRKVTGTKDGAEAEIFNGEVSEYYSVNNGEAIMYGSHSRFFEDTYYSEALGAEETYRIYLPEGYFDPDNTKRYPSLYLFHGINSQSMTYAIDRINEVMDRAIAAGQIDEMIVVIPDDPTKSSFWRGNYAKMVTDDLLPTVDQRYRTIDDERYRFTSGCSMGGAGSYNIGITNPNLYSGIVSFYGALNYVNGEATTSALSAEYLKMYSIYMACGNQDMYNFYDVQEKVSNILSTKGVEHYHYVDIGTHSNIFYLPLFIPSLVYTQDRMYRTSDSAGVLSGTAAAQITDEGLKVDYTLNVSGSISGYLNQIVASDYTKETNPAVQIPVEIAVYQNGVRVADKTVYYETKAALSKNDSVIIPADDIDAADEITVKVYASALENTKLIGSATVNERKDHWVQSGDRWQYSLANGTLATGWKKINDKWYFFDKDGWMKTGWVQDNGKWYYLSASGAMKTGWVQDNGKWYFLGASGAMKTGWVQDGSKWYYMSASGAMKTGWVQVDGKWYYMNTSGAMMTGWQKIGGAWYYMKASGAMVTGWYQVGSTYYYFYDSGKMAASTWIDNYYVDATGAWVRSR